MVSIHAPTIGRDEIELCQLDLHAVVSIHAPTIGRDGGAASDAGADEVSIHAPTIGRDSPANAVLAA